MDIIFKVLLVLHIIGGCTGLLTGTVSLFRKKGDKLHRRVGKLFLYGMLTAAFSSLVLSAIHPNYFLFTVGIFTIYMAGTGQRSLRLKNTAQGQKPLLVDYALSYGMLVAAVAFISFGIYHLVQHQNFGLVFLAFGVLSFRMVKKDVQHYKGKAADKNYWLTTHLQRMCGAYVAAATAFMVVNSPTFLPAYIIWLLPTAITLPLILTWIKKYGQRR